MRSLRGAKFETTSGVFDVRKLEGELVIEVSSQTPFPSNFYMRVIEALTFVSAYQAVWRATVVIDAEGETFRIASPILYSATTKQRRPLDMATLKDRRMFWRLFSRYLEFTVQNAPQTGWHPSFLHIHNAIEASANSFDAWALGLCVSVEGLARMIGMEMKDDEKETYRKLISHTDRFLKTLSWVGEKIRERVSGLLSTLHRPPVKDELSKLMERVSISNEMIAAWDRLRHPAAHGKVMDIESAAKADIQKNWNDLNSVTTLMYLIIFELIGYDEEYTDYSKPNWPYVRVRERPFVA